MSRLYFSPNVFLVEFLSQLINLLSANLWGQRELFPGGDHGWLAREVSFTVPAGKTVDKLSVYAMYKEDPIRTGVAYFDDIEVNVGLTKSGTMVFEDVTFPTSYTFNKDLQGVKSWQGYNNAPQVKMECVIILSACLHSPLTSISFKHSSPLMTVTEVCLHQWIRRL